MKTFRAVALIIVLTLISADTFAYGSGGWFREWRYRKQQKTIRHNDGPTNPNPQGPIGAPLDGGLLILLGTAGAAYYGVKKKKQVTE